MKRTTMTLSKNKRLFGILLAIAFLLLVPFIAMFFTDEVRWSAGDFAVAGGLLMAAGLGIELVLRTVKSVNGRFTIAFLVLAMLLLTWVELAVGVFGTPFAGS